MKFQRGQTVWDLGENPRCQVCGQPAEVANFYSLPEQVEGVAPLCRVDAAKIGPSDITRETLLPNAE